MKSFEVMSATSIGSCSLLEFIYNLPSSMILSDYCISWPKDHDDGLLDEFVALFTYKISIYLSNLYM